MKNEINNLRSIARQGLVECAHHELLHPYPVMAERKNDLVAQFKYSIAVRKEGPIIVCGSTLDTTKFSSEFKIADEAVLKLLAVSLCDLTCLGTLR
jgi:hypothetical protein